MVTTVHTAITSAVIRPTAVAIAQVVVVMTVGVAVGHLMTHAVGGVGSRSSRRLPGEEEGAEDREPTAGRQEEAGGG